MSDQISTISAEVNIIAARFGGDHHERYVGTLLNELGFSHSIARPRYPGQNWLSNRVFDTYDTIIDAACEAWRKLTSEPQTITSIGLRDWAHLGHS
jgi:hypothetical protein